MPVAVFQPARFERIHRVINEAASNPVRLSRSNDWFVTVDRSRSDFADLGRVKPASDVERKELESGKITIDGQTQSINQDFAQQSLLLARELDVSEHYAASLLQQGLTGRAKWGRPAVEVACILHHRERLALLACIKDLIRNALTLPFEQDSDSQRMGIKMEQLVESLVFHQTVTSSGAKKVTLPERVLLEIDSVKQAAARTRTSLESANSSMANQTIQTQTAGFFGLGASQNAPAAPSAGATAPTGRLGDEIQLERLGWMREERRELGHILYLLSISSLLSTTHISALLRWLAAVTAETYDEMTIYLLTALLGALDTSPDARLAMLERASRGTMRRTVESLLDDESFIASTHAEIGKLKWGLGELGSVVALQWSVFLVESFSRNSSFRSQLSIGEEQIQDLVLQAITGSNLSKDQKSSSSGPSGSALIFLVVRVLAFRQKTLDVLYGEEEATGPEADAAADLLNATTSEEEVDTEYREYVIQQIQNLIMGLTSIMLPLLRRIQRSEEDAAFALSRVSNARASVSLPKDRRYDIEALFDLIALLCRGRSEAGLPFWVGSDNRTTRFLAWAIDVREPGHQRALLNMLAAMSSGPQSASQAYALLDQESTLGANDSRLVSWTRFFEWITYYIDTFHQAVASGTFNSANYHTVAMPKNEETLLIGFVRLFRNVVFFSSPARDALLQHSDYNVLDRLFSLLTCPVPVELKASILDALAAFARNSGAQGNKFSSIATQLWDRLDACGLVPNEDVSKYRSENNFGSAFRPMGSRGVLFELDNLEVPLRTFPGSTSFVNFLKALVQLPAASPKSVGGLLSTQTPAGATPNPFSSIVAFNQQALHQSQQQKQTRSVEPYINFIIDQVLLKARTREYAEPAEQWRVVSACLDFVDRSLRSYDLTALLNNSEGSEVVSDPAVLTQLASHPGFYLMKRLLTGTSLVGELLGVLVPGSGVAAFEAINQNRASTLFYGSSIRHILSILERVLRNQDLFAQVPIPTLIDASIGGVSLPFNVSTRVGNSGAYTSFDLHLLHAHESVVQIALLVNCYRDDIALLSVRLLTLIAHTTAFSAVDRFGELGYRRKMNRLVGLLEMSDEAGRVKAGYVGRLEAEPTPDANSKTTEALLALTAGDDADDDVDLQSATGAFAGDAVEAIQIAILNLLLSNTETHQPAPNVAHMLLGYDLRAVRPEDQVIADPDSTASAPSALHAILALLRPEDDESSVQLLSLVERSPVFAEKCYALVLRLCTHPFTSAATLRYLRTQEDFVVQQLRSISLTPAERGAITSSSAALGVVQFTNGQMLETSIDRVIASLRLRASLLELTALELHALLNAGTQARAARVVSALFGPNAALGGAGGDDSAEADDLLVGTERDFRLGANGAEMRTFGGVRFLEMLQSLDFEWYDDREALGQSIQIVTPELLEAAKRADFATGSRTYDLKAVLAVLMRERSMLQQKGSLRDAGQSESFLEQAGFVLQWASAQNAKRAVAFSRRCVLQAWRHSLDMVLARATGLLRVETRSTLMFDCLSELLPRISAPSSELSLDTLSADLVAGAVLSLLTSLRQHRVEMSAIASDLDSADALPTDRLISILKALVDAVLRLETTTIARGNLYSAMINYLQLVKTSDVEVSSDASIDGSVIASDRDDTVSMGGFSNVSSFGGRAQGSSLEARTKTLLVSQADRLVDVLGRDALDASDLSKTIAFTLLDRLCALDSPSSFSSSRRGGSKSLDLLDRKGYIKSFVTALRDSDLALQETLRPDPSSLNAIYVYEARLAFFNRLAQSREGAEKLLSARIFDTLAQADFLAARPDQDQDFVDLDSFLPAATERYNALLMPVLQLSVSILASTSSALASSSTQGTYGNSKALAPTSAHAAPRHVVTLLSAHRDALLAVLRAPVQEFCSYSQLSQAHLVVSMFVFVLPTLDDDAQQSPNPLAPFHTAILAFAATYLDSHSWKARVVPNNDAEREEARLASATPRDVRASSEGAHEDETAFDTKVGSIVVRLQMTLLSYLEGASEARGNVATRTRPVLTPSLVSSRERSRTPYAAYEDGDASSSMPNGYLRSQQRMSAAGSNVPSIGTLVSALEDYTHSVNRDLQSLENMHSMLENVEGVRQDEVDEIIRDVDGFSSMFGGDLTEVAPSQRRSVATRELRARKSTVKAAVTCKLDAIELILVLLIRHIDFFSNSSAFESGSKSLPTKILPLPTLNRASNRADGSSFQQLGADRADMMAALAEILLPIIEDKVAFLNLPPTLVANARERSSFLQMAGRRLASFFATN